MTQARSTTAKDYHERILAVLVHIQRHLDDDLDLDALAAIAHFSPFHFHRIFSGMVGESVKEHVRRLRLERAAHQLKHGDDQVVRIALRAGYEAHESFTRAFTVMFGESPREFRAKHRVVVYPRAASGVHYSPDADGIVLSSRSTAMDVIIERLETKRVVFVRHVGPYNDAGRAWSRLMTWAGMKGLLGPRMETFGLCHDDPEVTPPDRMRYDACLVVGPSVAPDGDIGVQDALGGEYATVVHTGPYSTLAGPYAEVCAWIAASGRGVGDPPSVEFYLNDPRSTPAEQLKTKVCMRLA